MSDKELDELRDGQQVERRVRFAHLKGRKDISLQAIIKDWQRGRWPIARPAQREQVVDPADWSTRSLIVRHRDLRVAEPNGWRSIEDRVQRRAFVRLVEGAQVVRRHVLLDRMEPNLDGEHPSRMPEVAGVVQRAERQLCAPTAFRSRGSGNST